MFGMEKKSKEADVFVFDLEKLLEKPESRNELAKRIENRVRRIKEILHSGSSKENFDRLGVMLNGYHALALVLGRASKEPKLKK